MRAVNLGPRTVAILVAFALGASASCGYGREPAAPEQRPASGASAPPGAPEFGSGTVLIDVGSEAVLVEVEVAHTPEQRAFGLMRRTSLPADSGMVFLFFEAQRGSFHMRDTLIPLSIAFFDQKGRILRILDMEPCRREPCKSYDPDLAFWGALEVNQGAFDRWGAEEGDVVRLTQ